MWSILNSCAPNVFTSTKTKPHFAFSTSGCCTTLLRVSTFPEENKSCGIYSPRACVCVCECEWCRDWKQLASASWYIKPSLVWLVPPLHALMLSSLLFFLVILNTSTDFYHSLLTLLRAFAQFNNRNHFFLQLFRCIAPLPSLALLILVSHRLASCPRATSIYS